MSNIQKSKKNIDLISVLRDEMLNDITPAVIRIQLFLHKHSDNLTKKEIDKIAALQADMLSLGDIIKNINK